MFHTRQIFVTAATGFILAGCAATPLTGAIAPAVESITNLEWFIGPAPESRPVPARYCYASLGQTKCYPAPQAGEIGRLVGYTGPAPVGYQP